MRRLTNHEHPIDPPRAQGFVDASAPFPMNCQTHHYPERGSALSRRWFLRDCGIGLGKISLAALLTDAFRARVAAAGAANAGPIAVDPLLPKAPHFAGRARAVIHLFMAGAPSQLDLFDAKPELARLEGKPLPPSVIGGQRYAFIRPDAAVMSSRFKFRRYGQCGAELSELLPHIGGIADEICLIRSTRTDQFNHAPAQIFFNSGFSQPGRPSI